MYCIVLCIIKVNTKFYHLSEIWCALIRYTLEMATSKPLFQDLDKQIDLDDLETSEIESLCMNCHENVW